MNTNTDHSAQSAGNLAQGAGGHASVPWRAQLKTRRTHNIGIYDRSGTVVASLDVHQLSSQRAQERRWSEARLIAAAPQLLQALQAVLADCADIENDSCLSLHVGKQLRAAIEKATGAAQ